MEKSINEKLQQSLSELPKKSSKTYLKYWATSVLLTLEQKELVGKMQMLIKEKLCTKQKMRLKQEL